MNYNRMKVGLDDLVYSVMDDTTDVSGGTISYGTVYNLYGARAVSIDPGASIAWEQGDDGGFVVGETVGEMKISLEVADLLPADAARIFGQSYANGQRAQNTLDVSPFVAIGFRVLRMGTSSGSPIYDYAWVPKCVFQKPKADEATKGKTYTPRTVKIDGEFMMTLSNRNYFISARSDDTNVAAATITNWFTQPLYSNSADLNAFVLTSAVASISSKTFTLTFTKSGGGTTKIANASALNVLACVGSTGVQAALTVFTPGSAVTTPTIVITTSATLSGVPYVIAIGQGITDSSGVAAPPKTISVTPA